MNHFSESLVGGFRVVARAFVTSEGVLGRVSQRFVVSSGALQGAVDGLASRLRDVGIPYAEDHQELAADFAGVGQRSGVGVLAEFSIMDAGAVKADRCADIRLQR